MDNDVVITFDTTGSMYPCLHEVKQRVEAMVDRLFLTVPGLRLGVITHGDYCDPHPFWTHQQLTRNHAKVESTIRLAPKTGGGDSPEAYEFVLDLALNGMDWQAENRVVVMIGDDVPHEPSYKQNTKRLNWRETAVQYTQNGIKVHGVHCMGDQRRHSLWFYREIAAATGGRQLSLSQFSDIETLIMAVGHNQAGTLDKYTEELERTGGMTRGVATILLQLTTDGNLVLPGLGTASTDLATKALFAPRTDGLIAVPPGTYQVLSVPVRTTITKFVESTGAVFHAGYGYYEFTKPELVQERKEVVLVDRATGEMFSGAQARQFIGLPYGERGRVHPRWDSKWKVFIQSTSYTRVLMPGTKFLYRTI
jgi:hypothetical protein